MSNKENIENIATPVVEKTETTKTTKKTPAKKPPAPPARKKIKPVDLNELVEVQSCVYGSMDYISYGTGHKISWQTFGDTNWVTVGDLMEMRNSQRAFFEKQWVVLVGDNASEVMQYLQIDKYYNRIKSTEDFDEVFNYSPEEISAVVTNLSESTKETLARRAFMLIESGELNNYQVITALENSLGYDLKDPQ